MTCATHCPPAREFFFDDIAFSDALVGILFTEREGFEKFMVSFIDRGWLIAV